MGLGIFLSEEKREENLEQFRPSQNGGKVRLKGKGVK